MGMPLLEGQWHRPNRDHQHRITPGRLCILPINKAGAVNALQAQLLFGLNLRQRFGDAIPYSVIVPNDPPSFPPDDIRHQWGMKEESHAEQLKKMEAIRDVLASRGRSPVQGALCWLWAKSPVMIPIPGFRTETQVIENAGAMQFVPLNDREMKEIDVLLGRT